MPKVNFESIRQAIRQQNYEISLHAFRRMRQRGISVADIEAVILEGKIIERDPQAHPFPKCIFLGYSLQKGEALHIVCSVTVL